MHGDRRLPRLPPRARRRIRQLCIARALSTAPLIAAARAQSDGGRRCRHGPAFVDPPEQQLPPDRCGLRVTMHFHPEPPPSRTERVVTPILLRAVPDEQPV